MAKDDLDNAILNVGESGLVKPIILMLLDFQMPLKNGI
jgi:hypothetical protein